MSEFIYDGIRSREKKILLQKVHDSILPESRAEQLNFREDAV